MDDGKHSRFPPHRHQLAGVEDSADARGQNDLALVLLSLFCACILMYPEPWRSSGIPQGRSQTPKSTGIRFPDAVLALNGPAGITIVDHESHAIEQRFATLDLDSLGRLLVEVYPWRGKDPRLISARLEEPPERKEYENEGP